MSLVFFYPQFKKLTGAERLILKLSDYAARRPALRGRVLLLTHRFAEECRPALGPGVRLVETRWPLSVTGNHYIDAAFEYLLGPLLALRLPRRLDGVIFFGPPSVPSMLLTRRLLLPLRRSRVPLLYFCFEPPRFIYSDTEDIVARMGLAGKIASPLFALYRGLDRRMVQAAHVVLANSPYGAQRIWEAYRRRAVVVEHGVDLSPPRPATVACLRERYGLGERPVVVTVNHLHPRKRIDLFLRGVSETRRTVDGLAALIVGGGPEMERLQRLAEELQLVVGDDVVLTGPVPEDELADHYALGDIYVHTGRQESFGLSVIEALYLGLPVVSVDEGGPRETVRHGVSGLLVPATAEDLGRAIARLASDPQRARAMGAAGRQDILARYNWERGVDTLLRSLSVSKQRPTALASAARSEQR